MENKYTKSLNELSEITKDLLNQEQYDFLQKLIKKEKPRLVKFIKDGIGDNEAFGGTGSMSWYQAICPCCESELNDTSFSYCPYCSQCLDWGDEDDRI